MGKRIFHRDGYKIEINLTNMPKIYIKNPKIIDFKEFIYDIDYLYQVYEKVNMEILIIKNLDDFNFNNIRTISDIKNIKNLKFLINASNKIINSFILNIDYLRLSALLNFKN